MEKKGEKKNEIEWEKNKNKSRGFDNGKTLKCD